MTLHHFWLIPLLLSSYTYVSPFLSVQAVALVTFIEYFILLYYPLMFFLHFLDPMVLYPKMFKNLALILNVRL